MIVFHEKKRSLLNPLVREHRGILIIDFSNKLWIYAYYDGEKKIGVAHMACPALKDECLRHRMRRH